MKKILHIRERNILSFTHNSFRFPISWIQMLVITFLYTFLLPDIAKAVPSYARQTGMSCTACHYSFPELNAFGRQFKMNGYTLTFMKTIEAKKTAPRYKIESVKLFTLIRNGSDFIYTIGK